MLILRILEVMRAVVALGALVARRGVTVARSILAVLRLGTCRALARSGLRGAAREDVQSRNHGGTDDQDDRDRTDNDRPALLGLLIDGEPVAVIRWCGRVSTRRCVRSGLLEHILHARNARLGLLERLSLAHALRDIVLIAGDEVAVDLFLEFYHLRREHLALEQALDVHPELTHRCPPSCFSNLSMTRRTRTQRSVASPSSRDPEGVTR